ncbi:endonuclease/exonuclease/phosphatase family protein [Microlunatus sp. Y2014]|uniref:endonuclease/exonuclease/phosphatase family protein n=1 Tax=Microlunatus sp. Y2014 TaxID=3418488 RepID=UPI003DA7526B
MRTALARLAVLVTTALLVVSGLTVPAHASPPPVDLRVASYNIRYGAGEDGVFDLDRISAAIAELDADVIGLQEVDVHWGTRSNNLDVAQEIADRLGMYVGFAPIYDMEPANPGEPRRQFGVAVLSRYRIMEFTNHEIHRLSTQDPNPTPKPAPGFAEAEILVQGARVHVYSTHLDYRGDPTVRELQVADTVAILAAHDPSTTHILTGDLNATDPAPELQPLWGPLTNVIGFNDEPTYPAAVPRSRIDHIAVSSRVTILGADVPDTLLAASAADHRPLVADLQVPRGRH